MKQRPGLLAPCVLFATALAPSAVAGPQTFNSALPVAQGEFVFREQFVNRAAGDEAGTADPKLDVLGGVSVLGYGATRNLAVFAVLPYLDKNLRVTAADGQRVTRSTSGVGDMRLFGRYTVYQDDIIGRTLRIAPFLGVELPTGDDDDGDAMGTLPRTLQLGSGSWDPLGGVMLTYQTLAYEFDAQLSFQINTKANGFEFGDEARLDASFQYRLWPRTLPELGVPGFLYGVIESNLRHRGRNEIGGKKDANSGGTSWFLSPGLQYVTRRWVIEANIQLPVVQDLYGTALEDDYVLRVGFRVNF